MRGAFLRYSDDFIAPYEGTLAGTVPGTLAATEMAPFIAER